MTKLALITGGDAEKIARMYADYNSDIIDKLGIVIEPQPRRFREALRYAIEYRRNAIRDAALVDIPDDLRLIAFKLGLTDND